MSKVVFVNRFFYPDESATSRMLTDLARRLAAEHMDVRIVCSRLRYDNAAASLPSREEFEGIRVYRVWTSRFGGSGLIGRASDYLSFYLSAAVNLWKLVRREDIIVAKTDPPMLSVLGAIVARLRGATLINWLQDVFPEVALHLLANPLPEAATRWLYSVRDASLRAARCNVVLGARMRDHLLSRGIDTRSICIIENWADRLSVAPQPREQNRLRAAHGFADKFVVMYSGNLGRAHEYETILDSARLLDIEDECADADVVFAMIGGGAKMPAMRTAVERRGLRNVIFLPHQPRAALTDSLSAGDVHLACLLPALEGLIVPSKFYGILAVGRPVIFIGDVRGELAESIRAAGCGATVETGDGVALAREILRLKRDSRLWIEQGDRARSAFENHYTLDAATEKWRTVLTVTDASSRTATAVY